MIEYDALQIISEKYEHLDCSQSLKITATFASTPAGYDFPHLDNILAKAVVNEATHGQGLPRSSEPYWLPVPLTCAWQHPDSGLPLWKSTDFIPVGQNEKEAAYWHKRTVHPQFVQRKPGKFLNIRGTEGQDKEYRIPLPRNTATEWVAYCQGNLEEIGRLLSLTQSIGKKTTQGHGAILRFTIHRMTEFTFAKDNLILRPIPLGALPLMGSAYLQGWTPPYWLPATQGVALPTLAMVTPLL